jgi:hypothetical protein
MASSSPSHTELHNAGGGVVEKKEEPLHRDFGDLESDFDAGSSYDHTQRRLKPRHIQVCQVIFGGWSSADKAGG